MHCISFLWLDSNRQRPSATQSSMPGVPALKTQARGKGSCLAARKSEQPAPARCVCKHWATGLAPCSTAAAANHIRTERPASAARRTAAPWSFSSPGSRQGVFRMGALMGGSVPSLAWTLLGAPEPARAYLLWLGFRGNKQRWLES